MDVELQILKHLKRDARPTISVVDQYCSAHDDLFPEVRSYECFKYLHQGIISPIKRKSLPEIAKVVGISSSQSLHHFLANSPWSVRELQTRRLTLTLQALRGEKITVVINETGDRKKGKKTDYVAKQYLDSVGKIDNGIVSVNAYGVYKNITFPLIFKIFKPQERLKPTDRYQTKIELASSIITELVEFGFNIELVLADSLSGEASQFLSTLNKSQLLWLVAIRSNHEAWMPKNQSVCANKWCQFERICSNQNSEMRYIREIIYGKRHHITYWQLTTDTETMPEDSTSFLMTNLQSTMSNMTNTLGNLDGFRTRVEYAFRQCKQELGWTNYRLTNFAEINKWWEVVYSTYLMVSLNTPAFTSLDSNDVSNSQESFTNHEVNSHPQWNYQAGWKNILNNLRLVI